MGIGHIWSGVYWGIGQGGGAYTNTNASLSLAGVLDRRLFANLCWKLEPRREGLAESILESCGGIQEASLEASGAIWKSIGRHPGVIWKAAGRHLGAIWMAKGSGSDLGGAR